MLVKIIKILWKIIEVLWIMVAIIFLMVTFYHLTYYPDDKDFTVIFGLFLLLISNPGGHLFGLAGGYLLELFNIQFDALFFSAPFFSSPWALYLSHFIGWIIFVVIGYLQWFKLLPYLVGKLWGWRGWRRISDKYRAGGFRLSKSSSNQEEEYPVDQNRSNHDR